MTILESRSAAFAALLALHQIASAQSAHDACITLITSGLREYSINTESDAYLLNVFSHHCEKSGQVKTSTFGFGLDVVVSEIPFGLKGKSDNSRESMTNFCKNYAEVEQKNRKVDRREEKIVREAYRSFDACMVMANSGVIVRHDIRSFNDVVFFISPNYNGKISIKGIQTPPHVTCKGQHPNRELGSPAEVFDLNTSVSLNPTQSMNMVCTRSGRESADVEGIVYDEAVITMQTDIRPEGNYSAYLPDDRKIPETRASVLAQQMSQLEKHNAELRKRLDEQQGALLSGTTPVGDLHGGRGHELNVFIPFNDADGKEFEFKYVPHVVATVDKSRAQEGVYWTVNITGVTTKGFKARIFSVEKFHEPNYGWSRSAALQWMAFAKPKPEAVAAGN